MRSKVVWFLFILMVLRLWVIFWIVIALLAWTLIPLFVYRRRW